MGSFIVIKKEIKKWKFKFRIFLMYEINDEVRRWARPLFPKPIVSLCDVDPGIVSVIRVIIFAYFFYLELNRIVDQ